MEELRCYTTEELEEMREGILEAIVILQNDPSTANEPHPEVEKEYTELLRGIDTELMERALLT